MNPKHDEDFYGWAVNTAFLLKNHQYDEVDMDSVIIPPLYLRPERRSFTGGMINAHAQRLPYKHGLTKTPFQKTAHTHSSKSWTKSFCLK